MHKWIPKAVSKCYNDPTVNESEIIVLLGQVLGLCGKRESYDANGISLWEKRKLRCFINSDGENVRK